MDHSGLALIGASPFCYILGLPERAMTFEAWIDAEDFRAHCLRVGGRIQPAPYEPARRQTRAPAATFPDRPLPDGWACQVVRRPGYTSIYAHADGVPLRVAAATTSEAIDLLHRAIATLADQNAQASPAPGPEA